MTVETFEKSLDLLLRCGQRTAYLHNFGEPLLHPLLVDFVDRCTALGVTASFFTNGVLVSREVLTALAEAGLRFLCVSEHTRGELGRVRELIAAGGLPIEVRDTFRPVGAALHTWAGRAVTRSALAAPDCADSDGRCLFERQRAAVILWDGRVNVCCIDVEGRGIQGTVDNYLADPERYRFRPIEVCTSCALMRGEEDLS